MLISIETHVTITCDFPGGGGGGGGVWTPFPPLDPHIGNVVFWHEQAHTSLCGLLLA